MHPLSFSIKTILVCIAACLAIAAGFLVLRNRDSATVGGGAAASKGETQTANPSISATACANEAFTVKSAHDQACEHGQPAPDIVTEPGSLKVDASALVTALEQARKGEAFSFTLPGDLHASGTVNVITIRPDGTRYVGGLLDGWRRASFFFSLDEKQRVGGEVIVFDTEQAFVLGGGSGAAEREGQGDPVWQEKRLGDVICHPLPLAPDEKQSATQLMGSGTGLVVAQAARLMPVPAYESRPGAPVVLMLVFDGAVIEGTHWNSTYNNGDPIVVSPSAFSDAQILAIWRRVAEDYAPFNVNVTTDHTAYTGAAYNRRIRCIITPDRDWYGTAGGVARVGSMGLDGDMYPCWVFNTGLDGAAEAVSHELGHTFSLRHHGQNPASGNSSSDGAYYYGHGGSTRQQGVAAPMSWAPIMGAAYYTSVNQWSRGEYTQANNSSQDDIRVIATWLSSAVPGLVDDGIGPARATAGPVAISGTAFQLQAGVITSSTDANFHRLVLPEARTVMLRAEPVESGSRISNLNIALEIQDAAGGTLAVFGTGHTPLSNTYETLSASGTQALASGTYFIKINGCGFLDPVTDGFSNYGSTGHYVLKGSIDTLLAPTASPAITMEPYDAGIGYPVSGLLTLSVIAIGDAPLTYLWHKDNRPLVNDARVSGADGATLTISNPVFADKGDYFVLVTDAAGRTLASRTVSAFDVAQPQPTITSQPVDIVASNYFAPPASLVFTVGVNPNSGPVNYQWLKDGIPLNNTGRYSGVATDTLHVNDVTAADSESAYSVRVFSHYGSVISNEARLVFALVEGNHWMLPAEGEWSTAANWSELAVPTGASTVYINGGVARVSAGMAAAGTVQLGLATGEHGTLVVGDGGTLAVNASLHAGRDGKGTLSIERGGNAGIGGAYVQNGQSALSVTAVPGRAGAYLTAQSATLAGMFIAAGYAPSGTLLHTAGGINGTFDRTSFEGADYVSGTAWVSGGADFVFTQTLAWTRADAQAHGTFTVAEGVSFEISTPLAANTAHTNAAWDGRSLTKRGDGTLVLAAGGSHTGMTSVQAGALTIGGTLAGPVASSGTLLLSGTAPRTGALASNGVLDFRSPDTGPYRVFTVDSLAGSGTLCMKFDPAAATGDKLVVLGNASGTCAIDVTLVADFSPESPPSLPIITINGADTAVFTGTVRRGQNTYPLQRQPNGTFTFARPAAALTWLVTTGTAAWNNPANWNQGMVPDANDSVYFDNSGTAVIGGGVIARNMTAYLGYTAGRSGAVIVTDDGRWENAGSIRVGYSGTGKLDIGGYGIVSVLSTANIGYYAGGSGHVAVRDDALFETDSTFYTGYYGAGWLDVSGNATVNSKGIVFIAYMTTGTGTATVRDDAQWKISSNLYVGGSGAALLDITDNATVRANNTWIGLGDTSNGEVVVSGSALWENTAGYLRVGFSGDGKLTVTDNATVRAATASFIAYNEDSAGEVVVSGSGLWKTGTMALYVGYLGAGKLNITGSGVVRDEGSASYIGSGTTGLGEVIVSGQGTWETGTNLYVGTSGTGRLAISGSGTVCGQRLTVIASSLGSIGEVTVGGNALWQTGTSQLYVGANGPGTLNIIGSGTVLTGGDGYIGYSVASRGRVAVGDKALWEIGANLYVGSVSYFADTLAITGSGIVRTGSNSYVGAGSTIYSGEILVTDNALWETRGDLAITISKLAIEGAGRVVVGGAFSDGWNSAISVILSPGRTVPPVTARTASLQSDLFITDLSSSSTIIHTTNGITINTGFSAIFSNASEVDYITGIARLANGNNDLICEHTLAWLADAPNAHGNFTIASGTYALDTPLADNPAGYRTYGWDGKSLVKLGAGTLVLAPGNTYTGTTTVQAGTLISNGSLGGPVIINNAATLRLFGSASFNGVLANNGILNFDSPASGPYRTLTVNSLAGSGTLRMIFSPSDGAGDRLVVLGSASGAQIVDLTITGEQPAPAALPLNASALQNLITVAGANTAAFAGTFTYGAHTYTIHQLPNGSLSITPGAAAEAQQVKAQLEAPGIATVTVTGTLDFSLLGSITITSGKTIVGADASATIKGNVTIPAGASNIDIVGVKFTGGSLDITGASAVDVIHCTFTDTPVSIAGGADNIAFSWNKFSATAGGTGGGSAMIINNAGTVTGIVLDHNLWGDGLKTDMPGATSARVYMFNNYFAASSNTAATISGDGAQILSVNNIYQDVSNPLTKQNGGLLRTLNNFISSSTGVAATGGDKVFVPAYSHLMHPAGLDVPGADILVQIITANAGNTDGQSSFTPAFAYASADVRVSASVTGSGAISNSTSAHVPAAGGFTLTANATGFAPNSVTRQWYRDNFAITGATAAAYIVTSASAAHAGNYAVTMTAPSPSGEIVTSGAFKVTVGELAPPLITTHPVSQTITAGGNATFSVAATGDMLAYQWKKNNTSISSATSASYTISNVRQTDAASYAVVVSNPAGTTASDPATLTVSNGGTGDTNTGGGGGGAPSLWWLAIAIMSLAIQGKMKRAASP